MWQVVEVPHDSGCGSGCVCSCRDGDGDGACACLGEKGSVAAEDMRGAVACSPYGQSDCRCGPACECGTDVSRELKEQWLQSHAKCDGGPPVVRGSCGCKMGGECSCVPACECI